MSNPTFTAAGELVFAHRQPDDRVVVQVGERTGPPFDDVVSPILLSRDGVHVAYVAVAGDRFIEVRDQEPGSSFLASRAVNAVPWIGFTHTGRLAYELLSGGGEFKAGRTSRARRRVVVDGIPGREYDALGMVCQWSPGDIHQACLVIGAEGTRDRLLLDGEETGLYDDIDWGSVTLVESGELQFLARQGRRFSRVSMTTRAMTMVPKPGPVRVEDAPATRGTTAPNVPAESTPARRRTSDLLGGEGA